VQWLAAAGRAVRLGEHGTNAVRNLKRVECRNGEFRRAGETQP
jgi:hypothetical protein